MTVSGTHDSDPWNFIDPAMNKIPGGRRLPKVGVLYFYRRCEEFPDVDAAFQPFLDDALKGSTVCNDTTKQDKKENGNTETEGRMTKRSRDDKQRREAYVAIAGMSQFTAKIYDEVR